MRRMLLLSVIFSMTLAFPVFQGMAHAAVEFSADMVIVPKGEEPMKGKIYVKGDKIRQETIEEADLDDHAGRKVLHGNALPVHRQDV
jgi:hypothetical protein